MLGCKRRREAERWGFLTSSGPPVTDVGSSSLEGAPKHLPYRIGKSRLSILGSVTANLRKEEANFRLDFMSCLPYLHSPQQNPDPACRKPRLVFEIPLRTGSRDLEAQRASSFPSRSSEAAILRHEPTRCAGKRSTLQRCVYRTTSSRNRGTIFGSIQSRTWKRELTLVSLNGLHALTE